MSYVPEPAIVICYDGDGGGWHYFAIQIDLCAENQLAAIDGLPSLLGRDILNRCRCNLDASQGKVTLEPHHADPNSGFVLGSPLP